MSANNPDRNETHPNPSTHNGNALITEKSPYLLQHAHNPVDWLPWGAEAFQRARGEDKPIFLSIGYSTCHWCHVMERESFENEEIARVLNENFVSVKVDREERPDVDSTYMTYVQMRNNGQGGWPMSVWLTPELTPFFGGTYFPPDERYGRAGFKTISRQIADLWRTRRDSLLEEGRQVTEAIQEHMDKQAREGSDSLPGERALTEFIHQCRGAFDERHGGFNGAPKFPRPAVYHLLLHLLGSAGSIISEDDRQVARHILVTSLEAMAAGGMYDQVGGGFHRYSVDARWHVPHFEKMLYDQAQLAGLYVEAARVLDRPDFAEIAGEVLDYARRDLGQEDGAFFSAEDADSLPTETGSEKLEGAFYVWNWSELQTLLDDQELSLAQRVYGAGEAGNVNPESDPHGELRDQNVLYRQLTDEQVAELRGLPLPEARQKLDNLRQKLFRQREKRPRPHRDDKVLTAWNALHIAALARAARRLREPTRVEQARQAVKFLKENLLDDQGKLLRTWREEPGGIPAFAADYAFLINALIQLYQADFDVSHLQWAFELQDQMDELYFDEKAGGYLSTPRRQPDSILSLKEVQDGAEPSPNSIAARNLLALATYQGRQEHRARAEDILKSTVSTLEQHPYAVPEMGIALAQALRPPRQAVICRESAEHEPSREMVAWLQQNAPEDILLIHLTTPRDREVLAQPALSAMQPGAEGAAVYVCEQFTCREPITDLANLKQTIKPPS